MVRSYSLITSTGNGVTSEIPGRRHKSETSNAWRWH
jgi:hypothetical protein